MDSYNPVGARIKKDTLLIVLWISVVLSFCFLLMRIYIRIKIFHRLSVDDAFLIMAWLMTLANASIWQAIWDALCLSIALISGKLRVLPPDVLPESHKFLRSLYAAYLISYSSLWSVKLSFLFFFRGLGHRIKRQRIIWWAVLAFVLASYAVCIGTLDYRCLLGPVINAFVACQRPKTVSYEYVTLRLATSLDVLTDASIILLSTNILWKIRITLRKKLALIAICSLTSFIITVAIIRLVVATRDRNVDLTWLILWGSVESSVAIIIACLASFRTLYTRSEKSRGSPMKADYRKAPDSGGVAINWPCSESVSLQDKGQNKTLISAKPAPWSSLESSTNLENPLATPGHVHARREFHVISERR